MTDPEQADHGGLSMTEEELLVWLDADQQWRKVVDDEPGQHAGVVIASTLVAFTVGRGLPSAVGLLARTNDEMLRRTCLALLSWFVRDLRERFNDEEIHAQAGGHFTTSGEALITLLEPVPDDTSGLNEDGTIN